MDILFVGWQLYKDSDPAKAEQFKAELEDCLLSELAGDGWLNDRGEFDPEYHYQSLQG